MIYSNQALTIACSPSSVRPSSVHRYLSVTLLSCGGAVPGFVFKTNCTALEIPLATTAYRS
eukprot:11096-Heterococcus_DN1.PRE.2